MGLAEWIAEFRVLHQRAGRMELDPSEQRLYRAARDELARALVGVQRLTLKPGELPRQALRVGRVLPVQLDLATGRQEAVTLDISIGGFAAWLGRAPGPAETGTCSLKVPSGQGIDCGIQVVNVALMPGRVRCSFRFQGIQHADVERLERVIFDTVLEQIRL